jgi:SAM-dependent methyltransferase
MDDIHAPSTDGSENQDPRLIVTRGYDTLKGRYHEWTTANDPRYRVEYLHYLLDLLPSGANVLELGCGSGLPVARAVSENHSYIGVDISEEQLKLARKNAPQGRYVKADMSAIAFHRESLDAVVAFYSIFHVPRAEHPSLVEKIASWIRPGGLFVANFGARDDPGSVDEWVEEVPMFWSSYDADTNMNLLRAAGFHSLRSEVLANFEDEREVYFLWIIGQKGKRRC